MTVGINGGWERGRVSTGDGKSRGSARKSLRLAKLRNMETPEPISRNRAADIRGLGRRRPLGREEEVYANIFPTPAENRGSLSRLSLSFSLYSRAPPPRLSEPPFPFSPRSSLFCCSLSRAFHAVFSPALYLFLSFDACEKKKKRKREERKNENEGESR